MDFTKEIKNYLTYNIRNSNLKMVEMKIIPKPPSENFKIFRQISKDFDKTDRDNTFYVEYLLKDVVKRTYHLYRNSIYVDDYREQSGMFDKKFVGDIIYPPKHPFNVTTDAFDDLDYKKFCDNLPDMELRKEYRKEPTSGPGYIIQYSTDFKELC